MITEENRTEPIDNEFDADMNANRCGESEGADAAVDADNMTAEEAAGSDNTSNVSDEAAEWKDKFQRLYAEFDNYRRRTLREKKELADTGCEDVIRSLLNVMDDIDRAMDSIKTSENTESLREGVVLIYNKLMEVLHSKGVSEIDAMGKPLDTDLQEAVAKIPVAQDMKGRVVDVVQKGYKLKDKVVRYAKVVVGE